MRVLARLLTFSACLSVSFLLLVQPCFASETIRVALADDAVQVRIVAPNSVRLRFSTGDRTVNYSPLVIQPQADGGMRVNGNPNPDSRVFVEPKRGDLKFIVKRNAAPSKQGNAGREWVVEGAIELQNLGSKLLVINRVDLEDYVGGVVSGEINANWHYEALKAQAVAARTYVLYKKMMSQGQSFDVVSSVQDQVYKGTAQINPRVRKAVRATQALVVTYHKRPIYAAYSSTAAGPTEDALYVWGLDLPYLKGVECPFDEKSPRYEWRAAFSLNNLETRLRQGGFRVGTIATMTPYTFTPGGRVDRIRILHSRGELILRGQDLRRVVGYSTIFSTQFHIERFGREVILTGKGAGHGVGMCQWGMKEMAELGYDYAAILQYYYPDTDLRRLPYVKLTAPDS